MLLRDWLTLSRAVPGASTPINISDYRAFRRLVSRGSLLLSPCLTFIHFRSNQCANIFCERIVMSRANPSSSPFANPRLSANTTSKTSKYSSACAIAVRSGLGSGLPPRETLPLGARPLTKPPCLRSDIFAPRWPARAWCSLVRLRASPAAADASNSQVLREEAHLAEVPCAPSLSPEATGTIMAIRVTRSSAPRRRFSISNDATTRALPSHCRLPQISANLSFNI